MAKWLMIAGGLLLLIGLLLQVAPGLLQWFGRLPGDIRIDTAHGRIFIPITSMVLVSILLTALISLFRR